MGREERICLEIDVCHDADGCARGIKDGGWVSVTGPESNSRARMKAFVTERVGEGVAWMPFHLAGWYEGTDLRPMYPKGADPILLGESVNTLTTYGYDPSTGMPEPKALFVRSRRRKWCRPQHRLQCLRHRPQKRE
ncbi:molybdopterin dinucleotide binding domain-containing protein [Bradyrhizobium brasilense]|nr:molybdopterin dinucleotide binding domain-containing protein [Bradyrhizobium australafricanum]WFU34315.1 molybdopterin dinucleotide binding domain-containing protein [Bradyrhizobium australafricanum]